MMRRKMIPIKYVPWMFTGSVILSVTTSLMF